MTWWALWSNVFTFTNFKTSEHADRKFVRKMADIIVPCHEDWARLHLREKDNDNEPS